MKGIYFVLMAGMFVSSSVFAYTFDSDVPQNIQNQMTQDLEFITTIQGGNGSAYHGQVFGQVAGTAYKNFFEARVTAIGLNSCGNANAVACVIPFFDSSKMWITQNYIRFSHPEIARLMVVFHEARHTEDRNSNWPHARCPTPFLDEQGREMRSIWTGAPLAGEAACDSTPFGSYGSSTIMLKNIQRFCTNCTDKVKSDAGLYAEDQLGRISNATAKANIRRDVFN